jgi:Ras-related protein Rab-32
MTRVYYKEAVGCFIVFDVTRGSTFEAVTKWKTDLDNKVQLPDGNPVPCVLLANKVSLIGREIAMIFFLILV